MAKRRTIPLYAYELKKYLKVNYIFRISSDDYSSVCILSHVNLLKCYVKSFLWTIHFHMSWNYPHFPFHPIYCYIFPPTYLETTFHFPLSLLFSKISPFLYNRGYSSLLADKPFLLLTPFWSKYCDEQPFPVCRCSLCEKGSSDTPAESVQTL